MIKDDKGTPDEGRIVQFEGNPLVDPEGYLGFLKQRNSQYDYGETGLKITPEMIRKAVEYALSRGWDPSELNPAQIVLAQDLLPGQRTLADEAEAVEESRRVLLEERRNQLESVLASPQSIWIHATPSLENVHAILESGLYCDSHLGLAGSAVHLRPVPPGAKQEAKDRIVAENIKSIGSPHRGHQYIIVLELPELSPKDLADYRARRSRGESKDPSSYFVKPLPEAVGARGVERTYDAVIPAAYIKGYIDLDSGEFIETKDIGVA